MNTAVETTFVAPYHQLNKKTLFDSNKRYYTFINWVSGEFDLYLQDESNGLHVYFPEGKFHITEWLNSSIHRLSADCASIFN